LGGQPDKCFRAGVCSTEQSRHREDSVARWRLARTRWRPVRIGARGHLL